jgi:hypothetical protein
MSWIASVLLRKFRGIPSKSHYRGGWASYDVCFAGIGGKTALPRICLEATQNLALRAPQRAVEETLLI